MRPYLLSALLLLGAAWVPGAWATADGPDFFAVTGVAPDDVLNLREGPSARTGKIGEIPHDGRGLRNLGCQGLPSFGEWEKMTSEERTESRRRYWCKIRYAGSEGWVAGRYLREDGPPARAASTPSPADLANAAYSGVYDVPVRLVNGVYEGEPFVPGAAARPRVELLSDLQVAGDIDGNGTDDAWVLLSESSGGSGSYLFLAAVTGSGADTRNIGTLRIGDRVDVMALDADNGRARLQYVTQGPGEAACCPTLIVSSLFGLEEAKLTELSRTELGTLSIERLEGTSWRLTSFGRSAPAPEGVSITANFEGGRIAGSAGCNNYFATLSAATPYRLQIGPIGATRKACPPVPMETEQRFLEALKGATQLSFVLGRVVFTTKVGDAYGSLVFERLEQD